MWCLNFWLIFVSVITIIVSTLILVIWGVHWYPYHIYRNEQKGNSPQKNLSIWRIISVYELYTRENGIRVCDVYILQGLKSSLIYLGIIVGTWLCFCVLSLFYPCISKYGPLFYTGILIISTTVIYPELFLKYAKIPGSLIRDFPFDLPETPMYWGGLVAVFGSILILRKLGIYQDLSGLIFIAKIKAILGITSLTQVPLRAFGFFFAIMIPAIWNAPYGTWVSFMLSWLLGFFTISLFVLFM